MTDHPFRTAWRIRNLDEWIEGLSVDVVLRSPVVRKPFRGRSAARKLYGVLFETFGEVEITSELTSTDNTHAFFWQADVGGRRIEGTDLLRYDEHGKVTEVTVMIRPLVSIAIFASAIGSPLAAKQSAARGALGRLLTLPLKSIFTLIDVTASRLLGLR